MQPIAGERLGGNSLRLRDLIFVMRENQVKAAGVYVKRFAQVLHGHHGALNVPARTAGPDGALPERLTVLGRLPQNEIAGVGLVVFIGVNARAYSNTAEIVVRELAVLG